MEAIGGAPALVLGGLVLLSLLIAGLLMRRRQAGLQAQIQLLRRDRHRLADKLRAGRVRVGALRTTVARLEQINWRLLQEQDRLESEHNVLSHRFANLEARIADGGPVLVSDPMTEHVPPDVSAAPLRPSASVTPLTRPGRRPPTLPAYAQAASNCDSVSQRHATVPLEAIDSDQVITTELGPDSLDDDFVDSGFDGRNSIEKVITHLPLKLIKVRQESMAVSQRMVNPVASVDRVMGVDDGGGSPTQAEADVVSRLTLRRAGTDLVSIAEMRQQLNDQDAEIQRLRGQLSPLLGLPLVVSARESERDWLAKRLAEREARLRELEPARSLVAAAFEAAGLDQSEPCHGLSTDVDHDEDAAHAWPAPVSTAIEPAREANELDVSKRILSDGPQPVRQYAHAPLQTDNLKRIRGIGPVIERMLNRLGVYQYQQIAAWTPADVAFFDQALQDFSGRIERDDWIRGAQIQFARHYLQESK